METQQIAYELENLYGDWEVVSHSCNEKGMTVLLLHKGRDGKK